MPHANTAVFRNRLLQELADRKSKNPHYSLRAFSRDLGLNPTTLSLVLARKREPSLTSRKVIAEKLGLSPAEEGISSAASKKRTLKEDEFRLMADWFHLAILSLAKLKNNRAEPEWIGNHLGIPKVVAQVAMDRLIRLGLLVVRNGRLVRLPQNLETSSDIPSAAIRRFHQQILGLASASLDIDPVERREFTAAVMAIDSRQLARAKKLIREFRDLFLELPESGSPSQVYALSIQFFPLSKKGRPHEKPIR